MKVFLLLLFLLTGCVSVTKDKSTEWNLTETYGGEFSLVKGRKSIILDQPFIERMFEDNIRFTITGFGVTEIDLYNKDLKNKLLSERIYESFIQSLRPTVSPICIGCGEI